MLVVCLAGACDRENGKADPDAGEWIRVIGYADAEEVRRHLASGADPDARITPGGMTPLMISETADVVKLLLAHGADVHARGEDGSTALHHALFLPEALEVVPLLLDAGAEVDAVAEGRQQHTPLLALRTLMIEGDDPRRAAELMRLLVAKGADVNARDADGYTLLISAAVNDEPELARIALELGVDPGIRCGDGVTAMEYARELGAVRVVEVIVGVGR